jgi:hypothetical protein
MKVRALIELTIMHVEAVCDMFSSMCRDDHRRHARPVPTGRSFHLGAHRHCQRVIAALTCIYYAGQAALKHNVYKECDAST